MRPSQWKAQARISGSERQGVETFGGPGLSLPMPPGEGSAKPVNHLRPQIHLPSWSSFFCLSESLGFATVVVSKR